MNAVPVPVKKYFGYGYILERTNFYLIAYFEKPRWFWNLAAINSVFERF